MTEGIITAIPAEPLPMSSDQALWFLVAVVLAALLVCVEWPG